MLACVDVDYRDPDALAACCLFAAWDDGAPARELTAWVTGVAAYEPGRFYKRELPCLLAVLGQVSEPLDLVVVDSYVWLDDEDHPGLGAHLYRALDGRVPVVGVAKTRYASATTARAVQRGVGHNPLFVTAAGVDVGQAAAWVQAMHGDCRVPTLLRRVDRLARETPSPPAPCS